MEKRKIIVEKLNEAATSVLPIVNIVAILCLLLIPIQTDLMLAFVIGPLTAAFMLPFAMGAVSAIGGNVMTDAFGLVALVAMMPLITVQIMGVIAAVSSRRAAGKPAVAAHGENNIIELWEM